MPGRMQGPRTSLLASLVVVGTGALWGVYWLPVRRLSEAGLPGAWGTLAIVAAAALLLAPSALRRRRQLVAADPLTLAAVALGGAAFVLYSVGFVYGRVAIVILLFYLTPVWSALLARFVMGWPVPALRVLAVAVGLSGLAVMLGADGTLPLPRGIGEWLALASGLLWAGTTTAIRARAPLDPSAAAFVFALGGCAAAALLTLLLVSSPQAPDAPQLLPLLVWAVPAGALWWGVSMIGLMWAVARLEPARAGILLMSEVLVGAASAAWLAGEWLSTAEFIGGALVLCAAVLEVWPVSRHRRRARP